MTEPARSKQSPEDPSEPSEELEPSEPPRVRPSSGLRGTVGLVATLVASALLAVLAQRSGRAERAAHSSAPPASPPEPPVTTGNPLAPTITGKVVERLDVPNYTYLALDTGSRGAPTWVAVTSASVQPGERVTVLDAQLMTDFASARLKRTFARIYFGMLEGGGAAHPGAAPHAGVPPAPPSTPTR